MNEFSVGTRVENIYPSNSRYLGAKGTVGTVYTSMPAVQVVWDNDAKISLGSFCFMERLRVIDEESDVESIW